MSEKKRYKEGETKKRQIQSISRASNILKIFMNEKGPLGITDFSKRLTLPKTTVQGIVDTLVQLNYLERDPVTSKYRLGPMLFQLGMSYASNMDIVTISKVWMERLSLKFGEPVNTGMLVGNKIIIIFRAEPETGYAFFPQSGIVIPAHTTCIGKLILAYLDEKHRANFLKDYEYRAFTKNSIKSSKEFAEELNQVNKTGISFDNEENIKGLSGIGGPIFNHKGQLIAAFAVTGNTANIEREKKRIIDEVRSTSREVSGMLGYIQD